MLRPATEADLPLLQAMLLEAVNWDGARPRLSLEQAMGEASVAHYVTGWPSGGDVGIVAVDDGSGGDRAIGAAWYRFFAADDPGYGFVAVDVPEVSIGVDAAWRGRGVGTSLLGALHAAARVAGVPRLSLSVERANPARTLYERLGYRDDDDDEGDGDGGSITMVIDL